MGTDTGESTTCICGHGPRDHRRIDAADDLTADFVQEGDTPRELRVMRSYCGVPTKWDHWGAYRCNCVLYTPTALLQAQFSAMTADDATTNRHDEQEE